ncbi:MAG: PIG-L family deacetylase [Bacteroidota bacterium]
MLYRCCFLAPIALLFLLASPALAQKKLLPLAPTETYPEDTYLASCKKKRAMVIVAHDDDSGAMSGTLARLKSEGWTIHHLSFPGEDSARSHRHVAATQHLAQSITFLPFAEPQYRPRRDTAQPPYMPIPRAAFAQEFALEEIARQVEATVNAFDPAIIFTLDSEIGGYGHPDHVMISELVVTLTNSGRIYPERIYQNVYTDHMEEEIMVKRLAPKLKKWGYPSPYTAACELYAINGMPEPTVQVTISPWAEEKMQRLRGYAGREARNLRKFIPDFDKYPAQTYFEVFDREFFRVLEF